MIEEIGFVVQVGENTAVVRTERSSACEGCASAGFCHMAEGEQEVSVEAENPLHAVKGQKVRISIPTASFLKGTFMLYLFPLIGLFAGMIPGYLWRGETGSAAGGLLGLFSFFLLQRVINRYFVADRRYRPVITEIL